MKENNITLMLAYPKKDVDYGINLIEGGLKELSKIFEVILGGAYYKEEVKRGEMVISNIKEYINNVKNYKDISNSQITGCDYKPEPSIFDLIDSLDESLWNAIP